MGLGAAMSLLRVDDERDRLDRATDANEHLLGPRHRGLRRSARLVRLFRCEQSEPDRYYACLAEDTALQIEEYTSLAGLIVFDVGGGPGHFTAAFRNRGARCTLIEPDLAEMISLGAAPQG